MITVMKGLYLHIPFCKSKCPYCDFNSYVGKEELMQEYVSAMISHIRQSKEQIPNRFDTIFIGGGTPTALSDSLLKELLKNLRQLFPDTVSEFTVEANPKTLTPEKLRILREYGVNRMSLGLQAWQDSLLKKLGRTHTRADFLESLEMIASSGINNVNADVMYGLPEQTIDDWSETLESLSALDLPHISCYSLTIAEGTPFAQKLPASLPDEDTEREMNHLSKKLLSKKKIFPYEISNYAKVGYECKHNLIYWKGQEYAAFGAGASGYLKRTRYTWEENPEGYIRHVRENSIEPSTKEQVADLLGESIMLRLRLTEGVSFKEMEQQFGSDWIKPYESIIQKHSHNGLLQKNEHSFALTDYGFDLANYVMADFL